jgi:16S rRNA (uracil1498-N3)-methyltransferase
VVERSDPARVITFFSEHLVVAGEMQLSEDAAHHAHVRRVAVDDSIVLTDGRGQLGRGRISRLAKTAVVVVVDRVDASPPPPPIHLFLPVADRDRMLWLAEKATELQITSWNPVMYRRSRSVTPRGEGDAFDRKVRARMVSALEQSGGAWLPVMRRVVDPDAVLPLGAGVVLERGGRSLSGVVANGPLSLAIGPEGGFESDELETLAGLGWATASLGDITLRFETAAVAAIAIARCSIAPEREG